MNGAPSAGHSGARYAGTPVALAEGSRESKDSSRPTGSGLTLPGANAGQLECSDCNTQLGQSSKLSMLREEHGS
jgi:hypothetical protein